MDPLIPKKIICTGEKTDNQPKAKGIKQLKIIEM
jgi:hypothetical protein